MIKVLRKIIEFALRLILLLFAAYAIICVFIPMLKMGVPFIESVKIIAEGLWEGIKALFGA